MSEKPSYLGLLNAVAVGEAGGEALFTAWAASTTNPDVKAVLQTVALREAEHKSSFAKRINELGFTVRDTDDPGLPDRIATVTSTKLTDLEKFEKLGYGKRRDEGSDIFVRFFEDTTIDIQTGELLGRYISEERDSVRRLLGCYASLAASKSAKSNARQQLATNAKLDKNGKNGKKSTKK